MELIFKRGQQVLESLKYEDMEDDEKIDKLKETYNKQEIESYELVFNPGVLVEVVHDISDIEPEMIKSLIIKLK